MGPLLFTLFAAALPERLALTFEQEKGGCALDVRVPQSIAHYVPRLSIATASGEGTWTLRVIARPFEVEMVLADDRGAEQLRRVLRAEPEACAAAADGIGLILERYLSDLGYETGFAPLPEVPPPPPATSTIASRVDTDTPASAQPIELHLDIAGAGLLEASANGARGGGAIELAVAFRFLRFELGGFGLYRGTYDVARGGASIGQYRVGSIGGLLRAGGCLLLDPFSLCALAGGGIEQVRASTTGDTLFGGGRRNTEGALLSAGARAEWAIDRFRVYLRTDAMFRTPRVRIRVEGADHPYRDPRVAAFLSLGIAVEIL